MTLHLLHGQMKFEPLQTEVGLTLVNDICRDEEGYLWIANDGVGLVKHNSYSYNFV